MTETKSGFSRVERRLGNLENRVESLKTQAARSDVRLESIDASIVRTDGRLESIEKNVAHIDSTLLPLL